MTVWKEKKEALDQLLADSNVPKLKPGDHTNLLKIVKKLIGDTNPAVSQTAVKCVGSISNGLKKNFEPYIKELLPVLI